MDPCVCVCVCVCVRMCACVCVSCCLCHTVLSSSLVVTCWFDILCAKFFVCVFVTLTYGALGQVWFLIVSIPGICLLPYFIISSNNRRQASIKSHSLGVLT